MRKELIFRLFEVRIAPAATLLLAGQMALFAQTPQVPTQPGGAPTSDQQIAAQQAAATPPAKAEPDYPDPRTLITLGLYYWTTANGSGPDMRGGALSPDYATIYGLAKPKQSQAADIAVPVTRTGAVHLEYFRNQGTGNQTLTQNSDLFANQFYKGNYLANSYKIQGGKVYLDDLFWPHKFPVSRLRLKALYGFEYMTIVSTINAPLAPQTDSTGNAISTTGQGTRTLYLPSLGMAAEYAITPHILFRADASGFGLRHKSEVWDASATIAWRVKSFEVVGGYKAFHFKTSPNNTEYLTGTLSGAFVGMRFHFF